MPSTRQDEAFADSMNDHVLVSKKALDAAIVFIADELEPEDVFSDKKLSQWAESNGYVKE